MKRPIPRITLLLFATMGAACSGPEAVENPTWADVYPILQGQCLHCHGTSAERDGGSYRFDFLNALVTCKQEPADDLGQGFAPAPSFMASRRQILADILPAAPGLRPKMPPEPASELEDWQRKTLENFVAKIDVAPPADAVAVALGPLPAEARSPEIALDFVRIGTRLTVNYVVSDQNADPVIGELSVGDGLFHKIDGSGRGAVTFDPVPASGPLAIRARLCDGWGIRQRDADDGLPVVP